MFCEFTQVLPQIVFIFYFLRRKFISVKSKQARSVNLVRINEIENLSREKQQ